MTCGPRSRISPSSPGPARSPSRRTTTRSTSGSGPALGRGQLLVGVVLGRHDHDGCLREPVAGDDADPADLGRQVVVELRRLGRATPRIGPHPREDRLRAGCSLGGQVGEMERCARAGQGHALLGQEVRRPHRVERRRREQGATGEEGGHEPADAADVGEREDESRNVVGGDLEAFGHGQSRGHDREVGVRGTLRVGRRPRRVEEPPDGRVGGPGRHRLGDRKA